MVLKRLERLLEKQQVIQQEEQKVL